MQRTWSGCVKMHACLMVSILVGPSPCCTVQLVLPPQFRCGVRGR